jgi:hypothetical protein
MQLHANAKLTLAQRKEVRRLHIEENYSVRKLARLFNVSPKTILYWVNREVPLDKSSAPLHHFSVVTPDYHSAIIAYRTEHPSHGAIRIADALRPQFPQANRGSVARILKSEHLTEHVKQRHERHHIPVGLHRVQMDIQTLPAVKGGRGREYKISMIHLATRVKYSEIHSNHKSETLVAVFQRALEELPLFI